MATKRDLVEAYQFSRRRLVTAFVSGAPGGREVEPARPGRTIVGGVALGVLLMAGAAVSGVLAGRTPVDWQKQGLIISENKGQPYVITTDSTQPVLHPVINITSARLILGSDVAPVIVPEKTIQEQTIGSEIGILGAPSTVPDPQDLVETGWTSCTRSGHGVRTYLAGTPQVTVSDGAAFVVQNSGARWLIATSSEGETPQAFRYRLPPSKGGAQDQVLRDLGLGVGSDAVEVPVEWLDLWPEGGALTWQTFGIPAGGYGRKPSYAAAAGLPGARVGDVVHLPQGDALLAPSGPVALTTFAEAVYLASPPPGPHRPPISAKSLSTPFRSRPYVAANWPADRLQPVNGELCSVLQATAGQPASVRLGTAPGADASSQAVRRGKRTAGVEPGRGAFVLSADFVQRTRGLPFLIDSKASSHLLDGNAATQLGYGGYHAPVVPDTWIKLVRPGAVLSESAALCQPVRDTGKGCT